MSANDIVLIISAVTSGLLSIIGAVFAGWIALRQLPRQAARTEEVHKLVNQNFTEQKMKVAALEAVIETMRDELLSSAQAILVERAREGERDA